MEKFDTELILKKSKLFWQYPVITEEEFYNQNKDDPYYLGFPWATCIDKKVHTNIILKLILPFLKHKNYYTCCQHIYFKKLIPLFKILGIKTLYIPHKIKDEDKLNGINLMPCPLYAVNVEDNNRNKEFKERDFLKKERKYLFSFMGGYQNIYLTDIRKKIFELKYKDTLIINTGVWHFNSTVYSNKQNIKKELNVNNEHNIKTKFYNELLLNSRYCLCPSGSGPNSIRFWEALAVGSIPVLLADTLELPYDISWENIIIKYPENKIDKLYEYLNSISKEEENEMRRKCIETYNYLSKNFTNIRNYFNNKQKTLFTSYSCNIDEVLIQKIIRDWKVKNRNFNIVYFSDNDVNLFFKNTIYYDIFKKMRNGVAIADFFRICYINKNGGYWFDIDLSPTKINIPNYGSLHLFDLGYKNISYMLIGGYPNNKLLEDTIHIVCENIKENSIKKKKHVMEITGPRIIQNLICDKLKIKNYDGCLISNKEPIYILKKTDYEFVYIKLDIKESKTNDYKLLQKKYKKLNYYLLNFI